MKARSNNIIESIRHNKTILATIVTALALMVAIGTTYTLISPAATLEAYSEPEAAVSEVVLTVEEQAEVDKVTALIDELPEYEEIELTLADYENDEDMEGYEDYFRTVADKALSAYALYQELTPDQQSQVANGQKLLDMEWMWSADTYDVASAITVNYLNAPWNGDVRPVLVHGGSVREVIGTGNKYSFWDAIVVEKNSKGVLYVSEYISSGPEKLDCKASTNGGFVLLIHESQRTLLYPDCKVEVGFDYLNTSSGYSSGGYGTVSFTDVYVDNSTPETPDPQPQPNFSIKESADTSQFITMNVYDYGSKVNYPYNNVNKNYPGFQNPGGISTSSSVFGGSGFDFGDVLTSDGVQKGVTVIGGKNINALTSEATANKPISGMMAPTLVGGYPYIDAGNISMAYLFGGTDDYDCTTKLNSTNVNGLFQYDPVTGAYHFNSMDNHAQFDYDTDNFVLYEQMITSNAFMYPFGNFLPLNDIRTETTRAEDMDSVWVKDIASKASQKYSETSDSRYSTLKQTLERFDTEMNKLYPNWTYDDALGKYLSIGKVDYEQKKEDYPNYSTTHIPRLYNIDFDKNTDFFFGIDMAMEFMQPKGGLTGQDGKQPMVYNFTGDDDVLVYIDDILFLDLSGIHRHVGGKIDFVEGKVYYYQLMPFYGTIGPMSTEPYKIVTFEEILGSKKGLNDNGTFEDYSMHKFNFYYMERGSGSSVCRINFNFPLLKKNSIAVTKELTAADSDKNVSETLGDPDFRFQILDAADDTLFVAPGTEYEIRGIDGNVLGTGTTEPNGVFTLKAGQTAVFSGIEEDSGEYYVRELLDPDVFKQYGEIKVDGTTVTTNGNDVVVSDDFVGVDSSKKDISEGSTSFAFNNVMDFSELGKIQIEKVLNAREGSEESFDFEVMLDEKPIPAGTNYKVGTEKRTVTEAGIITIKPGEKAEISGIKAGTEFRIRETAESAEGYKVIYAGDNINVVAMGDAHVVSGIVLAGTSGNVYVKATNTDGAAVEIPVSKTVRYANVTNTFTFELYECDEDGKVFSEIPDQTLDITVNGNNESVTPEGEPADPKFMIAYPLTSENGTHYYLIKEKTGDDVNMIYDKTSHIVNVTVAWDESDGLLKAVKDHSVCGCESSDVAFTNTQLYSLNISKTVDGRENDTKAFAFTVALKDKEGNPLTGAYPWTGSEEPLAFDEKGKAEITLTHGQEITISGLDKGTQWTVTEVDGEDLSDGYQPYVTVNGAQTEEKTETVSGTLAAGKSNTAAFRNEVCYMLPEAGGIGTKPFHIGGLILILGAALLLMRQRRREA